MIRAAEALGEAADTLNTADTVTATELLLDGISVANAHRALDVLESAVLRLGSDTKPRTVDKHIIAPINRLARRAASIDDALCGRIQLLLARLFPLASDTNQRPATRAVDCASAAELQAAAVPPVETVPLDELVAQQGDVVDTALYKALWDCLGAAQNAHSVVAIATNTGSSRFSEFLQHCRVALGALQKSVAVCGPLSLDFTEEDEGMRAPRYTAHPMLLKYQLADTTFVFTALVQVLCALHSVPSLVEEQHRAQQARHQKRAAALKARGVVAGPAPEPLLGKDKLGQIAEIESRVTEQLRALTQRCGCRPGAVEQIKAFIEMRDYNDTAAGEFDQFAKEDLVQVCQKAKASTEQANEPPAVCKMPRIVSQEHFKRSQKLLDMCTQGKELTSLDKVLMHMPKIGVDVEEDTEDVLSTWKWYRLLARQDMARFIESVSNQAKEGEEEETVAEVPAKRARVAAAEAEKEDGEV